MPGQKRSFLSTVPRLHRVPLHELPTPAAPDNQDTTTRCQQQKVLHTVIPHEVSPVSQAAA